MRAGLGFTGNLYPMAGLGKILRGPERWGRAEMLMMKRNGGNK